MAKIRKNILVQGLSGGLAEQVVFRHLRDGRTIVCAKPDFSRRILSEGQKAHHAKLKAAAAYAREAAGREPIYAERAAGTMKNAYNMALADYFHPPVIHRVEPSETGLRIYASDDVRVANVSITIFGEDEGVLEKGDAVQVGDSEWWEYAAQHAGRVLVEARDLAGNVARMEGGLGIRG
ncbi:MAG TPA: hypothetical protein PKL78_05840 [Anaerolineales bacterium]|nr:hypothetical protein [Anaerolineales bacterium]